MPEPFESVPAPAAGTPKRRRGPKTRTITRTVTHSCGHTTRRTWRLPGTISEDQLDQQRHDLPAEAARDLCQDCMRESLLPHAEQIERGVAGRFDLEVPDIDPATGTPKQIDYARIRRSNYLTVAQSKVARHLRDERDGQLTPITYMTAIIDAGLARLARVQEHSPELLARRIELICRDLVRTLLINTNAKYWMLRHTPLRDIHAMVTPDRLLCSLVAARLAEGQHQAVELYDQLGQTIAGHSDDVITDALAHGATWLQALQQAKFLASFEYQQDRAPLKVW